MLLYIIQLVTAKFYIIVMQNVVIAVVDKDADEITQQLNQLELQLSAFQFEFATKYATFYYCRISGMNLLMYS